MGSEGQGGGVSGQDLFSLLLPLGAFAGGMAAPQSGASFQALAQIMALNQYRNALIEQDRRKQEMAGRERTAVAQAIGFPGGEDIDAPSQIGLATLRQQQKQFRVGEEQRGGKERVNQQLAQIESSLYTDDPDALTAALQGMRETGLTTEQTAKVSDLTDKLRKQRLSLLQGRTSTAPFFEQEEVYRATPAAPGEPEMFKGFPSPFDPTPLPLPEAGGGMPTVTSAPTEPPVLSAQRFPGGLGVSPLEAVLPNRPPEAIQQLREQIFLGREPKPEQIAAEFGVPLEKIAGGRELAQARVKPPYAPIVREHTDAQGNVTQLTTTVDPNTGQPRTIMEPRGPIGTPRAEPQLSQAEILNSLGMVVVGQSGKALPMHQGLTPEKAQEIRDVIRSASGSGDASLAAGIISIRMERLEKEVDDLSNRASGERNEQKKLRIETELTQKRLQLESLDRSMDIFVTQGISSVQRRQGVQTPTPAPPGSPGATERRKRLQESGILPK